MPGPSSHYPSFRRGYPDNGRNGVGYRRRYPYIYGGYVGLGPWSYGLPLAYALPYGDEQDDAGGSQPAPQQADYGDQLVNDYGPAAPQMAANAPPPFRPAYQEQTEFAPVHPQPITTLIFKDGRPPVKVQNYALTPSTLYALDGESRKEIPLSLLDVPATVTANRDAGVDFALPISR
jgi:hypothetical protein